MFFLCVRLFYNPIIRSFCTETGWRSCFKAYTSIRCVTLMMLMLRSPFVIGIITILLIFVSFEPKLPSQCGRDTKHLQTETSRSLCKRGTSSYYSTVKNIKLLSEYLHFLENRRVCEYKYQLHWAFCQRKFQLYFYKMRICWYHICDWNIACAVS